nr:extracellular solute-binding protein [Anaerolineae bacterium]
MNRRSKWFWLILVLAFALVLTACGPSETEEPTDEPTAEPTDEPTDEPTAEPTDVIEPIATIRIWADDTRSAILQELTDDFLVAYQVEVIVEEVASIRDNFVVAAPAGEGPDIFVGAHDWLGQVVASGLVLPIDLGDKAALFTDPALTGCTYAGELYCMPYATENLGFFYNTDLIDTPPTTWDELVQMGKDLQDAGEVDYGFVLSGTTYDAFPLQTAFGGYIFGRDADGNFNPNDLGVDSDGMIAAGDFMAQMVADGLMPETTDWDTAHVLFETGEVPFLMAGPWALDRIRAAGVPYAITTFPAGPAGEGLPFAGVQGFFVNAFSENPLLAQAFLTEFVATDEVMLALLEAGNRPSALIAVNESVDDPDLAALGVAGANAIPMPAIPEMGSVWGSWGDAITLILTGEQDAATALANAGAQIRDLIGGALAGMVNVPGDWQDEVGCAGDWAPDCEITALTEDGGLYTGEFELIAGDYQGKVALDGSWGVNYGVDGAQDGDNCTFSMAADGTVVFTFDPETHLLTIGGDATSDNCGGE